MKLSGDIICLDSIKGIKIDKHSTGGIGDKTTLIIGPVAAAAGVPIAKMSGRGLGFTGGTIDKLESIPDFNVNLNTKEFTEAVNRIGISIIGQTSDIVKADKLIYALRDVTGTVDNESLIASSVMSKKLASGSDAILLDIKCGSGAFMKTEEEAKKLGALMMKIGEAAGKKTIATITDMNQPLGLSVGNSLEVIEAIEVLKNNGPKDIRGLSIDLAGTMIMLGEKANTIEEGKIKAEEIIKNGEGLEKLKELIVSQGGNPKVIEDYELFPQSKYKEEIISDKEGQITEINAMKIGQLSQLLGAGRVEKTDSVDLSAGIVLTKKVGDFIKKGEVFATLHTSNKEKINEATKKSLNSYMVK